MKTRMNTDYVCVQVSLPKNFTGAMDKAIIDEGYASRAEFVKYLVRKYLEQREVKS